MKNTIAFLLVPIAISLGSVTSLAQIAMPPAGSVNVRAASNESDWLDVVVAAEVGIGFDSGAPRRSRSYTGVKLGRLPFWESLVLDLGNDRIQSTGAFSAEVSAILPVVRFPRAPKNPWAAATKYVRVYAEPGVGYRAGCPEVGGYGSAKVMLAVLSDERRDDVFRSPFLELQRRFPFSSPLGGDTRLIVGIMRAWRRDYCAR